MLAGDNFEIAVQIYKGANTNFARVLMEMPTSFEVDSASGDSARYKEDGSTVKYIWDRMPTKNELVVKFKISTDQSISGKKMVNGRFTYIVNEEKHEINIPDQAIEFMQPALTSIATQNTIPEIEQGVPTEAKITTLATNTLDEVTEDAEYKQPQTSTEASMLVEFRIQIVASSSERNIEQLKAKYNITERVQVERHNGLWKYTIGSYSAYGSAKGKLPIFQNEKGVAGAFITAYKNGQRISVGSAIK